MREDIKLKYNKIRQLEKEINKLLSEIKKDLFSELRMLDSLEGYTSLKDTDLNAFTVKFSSLTNSNLSAYHYDIKFQIELVIGYLDKSNTFRELIGLVQTLFDNKYIIYDRTKIYINSNILDTIYKVVY